jgi:hypothetical protein
MELIPKLVDGLGYLWMVFFIMISAGLAKEYNLFAPAYAYVKNTFRSNKFVVVLLSAIGGILPIEGRVTVSAGLLDTVAPKCGHGREKMGIVDYLSTHHYYMWSPLEKTVILPIAAFGLTYATFIGMIAPLLIVSLAFISWYIWYQVKEEEIVVTPGNFKISAVLRDVLPMFVALGVYIWTGGEHHVFAIFGCLTLYYVIITQQWNYKKLLGYVNWSVLAWVAAVIIAGNFFKSHNADFITFIKGSAFDPHTLLGMVLISATGFIVSFLMGSSGKFIAIAVLMAQVFGVEYFLWFFAIDYSAYLLSPTHKCVMIGNRYFGTPFKTYYLALGSWAALLLATAGIITFVI